MAGPDDLKAQSSVEAAYDKALAERKGNEFGRAIADDPKALGLPDNAESRVRMAAGFDGTSKSLKSGEGADRLPVDAATVTAMLDRSRDQLCTKAGPLLEQEIVDLRVKIDKDYTADGLKTLGKEAERQYEVAKLYEATCAAPTAAQPITAPKI